jgi:murein DD-endopeptidase MepM/ murein hydrolase activator NlpD
LRRLVELVLLISLLGTACHRNFPSTPPGDAYIPETVVVPGNTLAFEEAAASIAEIATHSFVESTPASPATPYASAMPLPTPSGQLIETYIVQWGDTLGSISLAYDVPIEELVELNELESESAIIQIGQALRVPLTVSRTAPTQLLLPDSELVFSPAYVNFDVTAFVAQQGGFFSDYASQVDDVWLSGAEIVSRVAREYSVGPRVLLALLEHYGGWVTQAQPLSYQPLGSENPYYEASFYFQLSWAANYVNEGYYLYKRKGVVPVRFVDGSRAMVPAGLNAGTAAIQNFLAINGSWESWEGEAQAFIDTYRRLFGEPYTLAVEPLVPAGLTQPTLRLPWKAGETFYYTGGPHAAYGTRSAWAAIDFVPPDIKHSCLYSSRDITAAADGRLSIGDPGEVYLDLDGDGNLQTGWVLLYLHVVPRDDVRQGQLLTAGEPLGYASCEGGISYATHLHFARRFNGEWMLADGPVPMVLSGWTVHSDMSEYDGTMVRDNVTKTACECWDDAVNALVGE